MDSDMVYAEDVNYWKSSTSHYDSWMDKTKRLIMSIGGLIGAEAFGANFGKSAFFLRFSIDRDSYQITWEVLPSKTRDDKAAKIQAATLMYHDVKHKVVMAKVKGVRRAFIEYLVLADGTTVGNADTDDLMRAMLIPASTNS